MSQTTSCTLAQLKRHQERRQVLPAPVFRAWSAYDRAATRLTNWLFPTVDVLPASWEDLTNAARRKAWEEKR